MFYNILGDLPFITFILIIESSLVGDLVIGSSLTALGRLIKGCDQSVLLHPLKGGIQCRFLDVIHPLGQF
jgi:hypothetical protein